jgi:hypothetical protein
VCACVCVCVCLSLSLCLVLSLDLVFLLFPLLLFLLNSWSIHLETGTLVRFRERGCRRGGFAVFFCARQGVERVGRETETCFFSSQEERQATERQREKN